MNKSILLMDVQEKCLDCNLCVLDMDASISCFYCKREICDNVGENVKRPDWCPLKPLPEKSTIENDMTDYQCGLVDGRNQCIDEIAG